jgi:hypothetical protein
MKNKGVNQLFVMGDSMVVVRHMVKKYLPKEPNLQRLSHLNS